MKQLFTVHPLEVVLLATTALLLAITMGATLHVALNDSAQGEDLTFAGTLRELSLMLESGGRDRLARLTRPTMPMGNKSIVVDKIELLADPSHEPAVANGGFIADQVALFNEHAIRRAVYETMFNGIARRRIDNQGPSLLRVFITEHGERALSERPNPFALTVRSPYAERGWRDVRTSDWRRTGGLLGLAGDVALANDVADGSRAQLNGRDCSIRNNAARLLFYCKSALASDVGRFYDLGFELHASDTKFGVRKALLYRPRELWRNGAIETFSNRAVQAGDVLDVPSIGPFLMSATEHGALASAQWINGRRTFTNQRLGAMNFFAGAGRFASSAETGSLVLGLDAAFSADLEYEARRFLAARPAVSRISIVVIDARTGELRAIAEPAHVGDNEPLIAFEPLLVGSVVKPILAAAILSRRPELSNLTVDYAGATVNTVAGLQLKSEFANAANGCSGRIVLADFIRCSSNQYAAELLVRSLRADGFRPGADTVVPREVLESSSIGSGLAEVFDVDAFGRRTAGRNPALWSDLLRGQLGTGQGRTNRALSPWEPRPWVIFPETDGTPLDWLARYAFGGWENRWTLLGIAEAYARIATGREVRTTILARRDVEVNATQTAPVPPHIDAAFGQLRSALRRVSVDGTAAGLASALAKSLPDDVVVLSKTGTLNEETDRFKALTLAIGLPANV